MKRTEHPQFVILAVSYFETVLTDKPELVPAFLKSPSDDRISELLGQSIFFAGRTLKNLYPDQEFDKQTVREYIEDGTVATLVKIREIALQAIVDGAAEVKGEFHA